MTYCLLRQDCRFERYTALQVYGIDCDAVNSGRPMCDVEEPVRITLSAYGTQRSDFLELPCPVVSGAMRAALESTGLDNVEYFKAELQFEYSEQVIHGYWVANVIGLVACVDPLASNYEGDPISGGRLLDFHIDRRQAYGLSLFRLAEDTRLVVISARVQAALAAARLQGLVFQETADYNGYPVDTGKLAVGRTARTDE
jgi:hypothetical protein